MVNLTSEYWDVNGTSLHTYASNIVTLGGSRSGVPTFRGSNTQFAARRGTAWRPKVPDQRSLTLAMQIIGTDADGVGSSTQLFKKNLRALQRLFWQPEARQFSLTKRWDEGTGIITATALAEFEDGLEPTMVGPKLAKTTVDLLLADPFFYTAQQSVTIAKGATVVINNPGDDICTKLILEFNGTLTNPTLTNATPDPDVWVKAGTTIGGTDKVTLDVDETTAKRTSDSASLVGAVTHSGARHWLGLARGNNSLTLTADAGTGNVVVKYQIPYF